MENKKIAIVIIVLLLITGTGTFVFASREGQFDEESIDYRNEEPTYKKVDEGIKGQDVPIIDNNTNTSTDNNNENTGNEIINSELGENNNSSTTPIQNNSTVSNTSSGNSNKKPNTNNSSTGSQTGTTQGGNEGSNTGNGTNNSTPTNPGTTVTPKPEDSKTEENIELQAALSYSSTVLTNQNVKVTITANKNIKVTNEKGWTITNNKAEKTFSKNASGEVIISDNNGKTQTLPYSITNIDKVKLVATVSYSETNKTYRPIEVIIKSDKEIEAISEKGWKYGDDKFTITKTFEENINQTIILEDKAKNQTEVNFKIENYDDTPKVNTNKNSNDISVTITYKKPIDGIDNWEQLENGDYQAIIPIENNENGFIILPNGEKLEYESAPNVLDIQVSNVVNGVSQKTTKPVTITIITDKQLKEPENLKDWTLSNDKKTLAFKDEKSGKVTIYDEKGNSTTVSYTVKKVDTVAPQIWKDDGASLTYKNGIISITLEITERATITGINWKSDAGLAFTKVYQESEVSNGITEIVKFKDSYDNETTYLLTLKKVDGKYKIEYEEID